MTFLAPSPFKPHWEKENEVPLAPFPQVEDALVEITWDDDDEVEAADDATLQAEEAYVPESQGAVNVKIDNYVFSKEMTTKDLRHCRSQERSGSCYRGLRHSKQSWMRSWRQKWQASYTERA